MGYQFARAVAATALIIGAAACGGGGGDGEQPAVLDNAREQVAAVTAPDASGETSADDADGTDGLAASAPAELPAPDPSTFEGANRVVNLLLDDDGPTATVDIWGRRTFTNGPVLLAEGIEFGAASEYVSAPPGYELVAVASGAGPDGEALGEMPNAADGEQITTVLTSLDPRGDESDPSLFEVGEQAPAAPGDGVGLVVLFAPNVGSFSDRLIESIGGDAFSIGDGSGACRAQRGEADGLSASLLDATEQIELELPPGPTTVSLHPWFRPDECDRPSVLDVVVDVVPDQTMLMLVFSRDGESIESIVLPADPVN